MTVWKDQEAKRPIFTVTRDFAIGPDGKRSGAHETRVCLDTHTGTHVDAPLHMLPEGAPLETEAQVEATDSRTSAWVGRGWVLDLTALPRGSAIGPGDIDGALEQLAVSVHDVRDSYLLLKTVNCQREWRTSFDPQFVYVGAAAARHLVELQVRGVGLDALGIERDQPGHPTHQALLGAGIMIVEGLRLAAVHAGEYTVVVAPLRLLDTDAAPARVLLVREMRPPIVTAM